MITITIYTVNGMTANRKVHLRRFLIKSTPCCVDYHKLYYMKMSNKIRNQFDPKVNSQRAVNFLTALCLFEFIYLPNTAADCT